MKLKVFCLMILLTCSVFVAGSQKIAIKSNLIYDALLSPNLGVEVAVTPRWTLDLSGNINAWTLSHDRKWKHWLVQPEARYWFCNKFSGHFVAFHALTGQYNIAGLNLKLNALDIDSSLRYQGWFAGAGVAYGYDFLLNKHWNIEAEIAFGYTYGKYDTYNCGNCGRLIDENRSRNYIGPTKAALNIVYLF